MPRSGSLNLVKKIDALMKSRAEYARGIEEIDETLIAIRSVVGASGSSVIPIKNVSKRGRQAEVNRRKKRGSFSTSGDESILAFIKSAGNPTTKQVNEQWEAGETQAAQTNPGQRRAWQPIYHGQSVTYSTHAVK